MRALFSALFCVALIAMHGAPASAQDTIPNDVTVTFTVCLEGTGDGTSAGPVCVIGAPAILGDWGNGAETPPAMTNTEGSLWTVDVTFPAGTDALVEYKYRKDDCSDWEGGDNRSFTLPTDGSTTLTLDADSFNRVSPIGCGLSQTTSEDKTICFQVCLEGISFTGDPCVIGNIPELGEWGTGLSMVQIGPDLYQKCMTFPAGSSVPLDMQYKFQINDCVDFEVLPSGPFDNREHQLTVDSPAVETLVSVWEDGPGTCSTVSGDEDSWGTVKARYRD